MANRRYTQFHYSHHNKMVTLHTKFTVLSTDPTGVTGFAQAGSGTFAGPTTTKGYGLGINQVYMNSSAAATGNNVAAGNLQIQLADPFQTLYDYDFKFSPHVTGGAIALTAGLTAGTMYQIVTVGTSTTANWQFVGLPTGLTPTVGQHFIASTSSAGTGNGTVKALAAAGITSVELGGDPDSQLFPNMSQIASGFNGGAAGTIWFNLYRTATLQQPADGTIVWGKLTFGSSTAFA